MELERWSDNGMTWKTLVLSAAVKSNSVLNSDLQHAWTRHVSLFILTCLKLMMNTAGRFAVLTFYDGTATCRHYVAEIYATILTAICNLFQRRSANQHETKQPTHLRKELYIASGTSPNPFQLVCILVQNDPIFQHAP